MFWRPYVPVAERRANAAREAEKLAKKGKPLTPISVAGRTIATSFWGKGWCEHLESYSDFANRLPRGRTYLRNGSVVDFKIEPGKIKAMVSGSSLYTVTIAINPLASTLWQALIKKCSGSVSSLVELLQGRFSSSVMQAVTDKKSGLFPAPGEIAMKCSCPDWAAMCKHCAAVLYGVGAKLDTTPELLFTLRQVNHLDLLVLPEAASVPHATSDRVLAGQDMSGLFGIELDGVGPVEKSVKTRSKTKLTTKLKAKPKPKRSKVKKKSKAVARKSGRLLKVRRNAPRAEKK